VERLILDTGVLIAAERGCLDLAALASRDDDLVIAAVTAAELLVEVERASEERRAARQTFTEGIFALVPVEDYTLDVARVHARLLAHVRTEGKPRGAHDLIIAATAAATGRSVMTLDDKAGFDALPGVRVAPAP
jgi:tRNA(fMet)-specific endonuclease VapC